MRNDKLTSRFQNALADAQSLAVGRDNQMIEPAHLLAALLDRLPKVEGTAGEVHVSQELSRLLNVTDKLAQQRGDQEVLLHAQRSAAGFYAKSGFQERGETFYEVGIAHIEMFKTL